MKTNKINYAKNLERDVLKARLSRVDGSMFEFAELLSTMKEEKIYKSLGFATFQKWYENWGFPKPTVYTWINVHATFVINFDFRKEELQEIEVRVLKALLPLARSGAMTKERLTEVMNDAKQMEFGKFLEKLPELKKYYGISIPR